MIMMNRCVIFFFFQAEDGIRDIGVTGVQTCALPILKIEACDLTTDELLKRMPKEQAITLVQGILRRMEESRSEERRVGKECRYRRSLDHKKKKKIKKKIIIDISNKISPRRAESYKNT